MENFNLTVVGGGPGGYVAAIKAAQLNLKVCLVEKQDLGGVCLNKGCIPTKAMLKSVQILNNVKNSQDFGVVDVDTSKATMDMFRLQKRKKQVVSKLTGGVSALLKANGVKVFKGTASFVDKNTLKVNEETIKSDNVIIATGSTPVKLPIEISGGDYCPCHVPCQTKDQCTRIITSDEALELTQVPPQLVIIGGGVIGVEFAYIYANLGSKVTIIELMDRILPMVDEEITKDVTKLLKSNGINVITGAKVTKISGSKVYYDLKGAEECVESSVVLMGVGRAPCTEGLNIESLGLKMNRKAIEVDEQMKTNVPGIYAIGDVNGTSMLAHTASMEGIVAVENILGHESRMDYTKIPTCIYLEPEIASVGLTEEEAKKKYSNVKVGRFPLSANGKATIEGEAKGLIKVIIDAEYNEILGVHIFGVHATDMIGEIVVALNLEATAEEIVNSIHPHPTVSEIIPEAFHAALGKAIHAL